MKQVYRNALRQYLRRRCSLFVLFTFTACNIVVGLIIASLIIQYNDGQVHDSTFVSITYFEEQIQQNNPLGIARTRKSRYKNYLRIDYTILRTLCKPITRFNSSRTVISLESATRSKLMTMTQGTLVDIDILSVTPILKNSVVIKPHPSPKFAEALCDYLLQLYIGLKFKSNCDDFCQSLQLGRLTHNRQLFDDPSDFSLQFQLFPLTGNAPSTTLQVNHALIAQSSIYFGKKVYICSCDGTRYLSELILDSSASLASIAMSPSRRSTVLVTNPLDENIYEDDRSSIYVSLSSLAAPNIYLRHESGRIKLGKYDRSKLFKRDATFKLIMSEKNSSLVAFQAINIPRSYIALDTETKFALTLQELDESSTTLDSYDKKFLFKLIVHS